MLATKTKFKHAVRGGISRGMRVDWEERERENTLKSRGGLIVDGGSIPIKKEQSSCQTFVIEAEL